MTKTNKRRRVASVLLALVMLFSLMPSQELHTHAFGTTTTPADIVPNAITTTGVRMCATVSSAPLTATTIAGFRPIVTTVVCA